MPTTTSDSNSTDVTTSTAVTANTTYSAEVVTLGTATRVVVNLQNQVVWTGSWVWYAYAYAWCAVWGPSGRRVTASAVAVDAGAEIQIARE